MWYILYDILGNEIDHSPNLDLLITLSKIYQQDNKTEYYIEKTEIVFTTTNQHLDMSRAVPKGKNLRIVRDPDDPEWRL